MNIITITSSKGHTWTYTQDDEDELWGAHREDGRKPMMARNDGDMARTTVEALRAEIDGWDELVAA